MLGGLFGCAPSFLLLAKRGLDKLDAATLKRRKNELRSEVSRRVAEAADTPLGDAIEAKLGGAVVDALFELVASSTELLSTPRERLTVLESKVADVKRELGLFRLAWHRVRAHARARPAGEHRLQGQPGEGEQLHTLIAHITYA